MLTSAIPPGISRRARGLRPEDTSEITHDVHRLSHRLHSSTLDYLGLLPALEKLRGRFSERHDISITLTHGVDAAIAPTLRSRPVSFPHRRGKPDQYRETQQGPLGATFRSAAAPDGIRLTVEDAGEGFDVTSAGEQGRSRALSACRNGYVPLHGTIHVDSAPSRGTRIDAWVPAMALDARVRRDRLFIMNRRPREAGPATMRMPGRNLP